jgi:hypothetical protein
MKLAVIAPPNALDIVRTVRTSFHLVLAQYVKDPAYRDFYKAMHHRGDFILLDNGAGEKEMMLLSELLAAAKLVQADEITLPDVIGDGALSARATIDAMPYVPEAQRAVCPHGKTWGEWETCAEQIVMAGCSTICIGRYDYLPGGRIPALEIIFKHQWHWNHHIHLFGCSEPSITATRTELKAAPWLRSMDTGAPIAFAQQDRALDDGPHASLEWNGPYNDRLALQNIERLLDVCNGG